MKKARMHSVLLLVFAVAACGGDDVGTGALSTTPDLAVPTAAAAPAPVGQQQQASLLPYIDNAKIPAAETGFATVRIKPVENFPPKQNTDGTGQFRFTCTFSHMSYNDPIVYPGKQGASHLHAFFGNTAIDHNSTQQSIETTGNSTCSGGIANRTGYWVPAVIDTKDGTPLKPHEITVYYKTSYTASKEVQAFPAGLRMIAGDMKAAAAQEHMKWYCLPPAPAEFTKYDNIPKDCPVKSIVQAEINFPYCWDGVNLDSPNHKSHMSYAVWNEVTKKVACPSSHPVELPVISEIVQYIVTEEGSTARWRLSSDNYSKDLPGGYSIHADWFNGWDPKVQDTWIKNCLQANRDCHSFLLGDGTMLF